MKIVCLIDNLSAGGAQRQMVMLAKLLKQNGHDITILTYYPHDFFLQEVLDFGIRYKCIEESRPLYRIIKIRRELRLLKEGLVVAFLKTPVLLAELSSLPYKKWKLIVSERNADARNDRQLIFRRLLHTLSDYVVVNSYTNQELISKNAPWLKNVRTIYNCVDSEYFSPGVCKKKEKSNNRLKVVAIGKYSSQKNIIGLIRALDYTIKNYEINIQIDWYGDKVLGSDVYKNAEKEIKRLNLNNIFFLHWPSKLILDIYRKSSVIILPSFYEGVPNVICEAMSCGLPILASDINDNSRFITSGVNGYLFNPYDEIDISNAMIEFFKLTESSRELMGLSSREKAKRIFGKDVFISEYLEIINTL